MNFQFLPTVQNQLQRIIIKMLINQMEKVEPQGHVENFVRLIRHLHPECNSSIRMAKELAMTQFSFTATCQQVNCPCHFKIYFFLKLKSIPVKIGSTSILHDSELPIDVGHCTDPGCYSRSINYTTRPANK